MRSRAVQNLGARACLLVLAIARADALAAEDPAPRPPVTDGLVAWYDVATLHRTHRHGAPIAAWPDASGRGHTLTEDGTGTPATFEAPGAGTRPHVAVHSSAYSVTPAFVLDDHTIVLVYAADKPARALFRSEADDFLGVLLRQDGRRDRFQGGAAAGDGVAYGQSIARSEGGFDVTILARREGRMRQFENGVDVSSGLELRETFRVGAMFGLRQTAYVTSDGEGLRIVEMLFYERYLDAAERRALLDWISERHGIAIGARRHELPLPDGRSHRVRLRTDRAASLGEIRAAPEGSSAPVVEHATVAWNMQDVTTSPFRHDAATAPQLLRSGRDGVKTELTVVLPVLANVTDVTLRVLLLENGTRYLEGELKSGALPTEGSPAILRLDAEVELDDGDSITVVTVPSGPPGASVSLVPDGALLVVPGP